MVKCTELDEENAGKNAKDAIDNLPKFRKNVKFPFQIWKF